MPDNHYECWKIFVNACCLLIQPSITNQELVILDKYLHDFCVSYEALYGKENCTPNMHLHLHLTDCITNYGPVYAYWCFPFERFNGVFASFQRNWASPEMQMIKKVLMYQEVVRMDVASALPPELLEFFKLNVCNSEITIGEGSLEQSHVDVYKLIDYQSNSRCSISNIDATENVCQVISTRYEKFLNPTEMVHITAVYNLLYPDKSISHIPMLYEKFFETQILHEVFISQHKRGKRSSAICAYWSGVGGNIIQASSQPQLRVGIVEYFLRHTISIKTTAAKSEKVAHMFAKVKWYRKHPKE